MAHGPSRHRHLPLQVEDPWGAGSYMEGQTPVGTQKVWSLENRLVGGSGLESIWEHGSLMSLGL